jgi:aminobenzoyl-glutamate utilization protein B
VITDGGFQPNVVPSKASVWYYFRETDEQHIRENWAIGDTIAQAAAMMTGTRVSNERLLGSAWPQHFNRVIAETMYRNIQRVGLPTWSDQDQQMAKALQREIGVPDSGLALRVDSLRPALRRDQIQGGGSDDIGDVSWNVPTVTLRFPSNIPGLPGHNWTDAIALATPIAHKGATAGAKAMAMTILDFVTTPALVDSSWSYFRNVQTQGQHYTPFIRPADRPAIDLNTSLIERFRPRMSRYYYDPSRYSTYLEQLGITYPTVRRPDGSCPSPAAQP